MFSTNYCWTKEKTEKKLGKHYADFQDWMIGKTVPMLSDFHTGFHIGDVEEFASKFGIVLLDK